MIKLSYKLLSLCGIVFSVFFVIIGTFAIFKATIPQLLISLLFLFVIYLLFLRKSWGTFYPLIKYASVISAIVVTVFIFIFFTNKSYNYISFIRFICIGMCSISILVPVNSDAILRLICRKVRYWPGIGEGLVVCRNSLYEIIKNFVFSVRCIPQQTDYNYKKRIYFIYLLILTFLYYMLSTYEDLLTSIYLRRFKINQTEVLNQNVNFLLCMFVGTIYFFTITIINK